MALGEFCIYKTLTILREQKEGRLQKEAVTPIPVKSTMLKTSLDARDLFTSESVNTHRNVLQSNS